MSLRKKAKFKNFHLMSCRLFDVMRGSIEVSMRQSPVKNTNMVLIVQILWKELRHCYLLAFILLPDVVNLFRRNSTNL